MRKREMQKIIKARAGLSNYSAITNIKWKCVRGIGATKWNALDDIITFSYKGLKFRLESKYTGEYSALRKHVLIGNMAFQSLPLALGLKDCKSKFMGRRLLTDK